MPYNHEITGRVIRELREERGVTQEILSGLAALSRSHLADIERGSVSPTVDTLWRVCDALGLKLSELIQRVEAETDRKEG